MPVDFLTAEQEQQYGRFAGEPSLDQLSRYWHFDNADLQVIRQRRGLHNWLGFALQLGAVRFLGSFAPALQDIPQGARQYVAAQLGVRNLDCLRDYQEQSRWRHSEEIRRRYGYVEFTSQPAHWRLVRWLYARTWTSHERPSVLFDLVTARLIEHKVLLPGASALARLIATVRERTTERLWRRLHEIPDAGCRLRLDRLLTVPINCRQTEFDRLRQPPTNPRVSGLLEALTRLEAVQALGVSPSALHELPRSRVQALARYAGASRAAVLARMPAERRTVTLLAFAAELSVTALDDVVTLLDEVMGSLLGRVDRATKRDRLRTLKDLDAAALVLRQACTALLANAGSEDVADTVFAAVPRADLEAAANRVGELAEGTTEQALERLLTRYPHVRRFLPDLLAKVPFAGGEAAEPVLESIAFLRASEGRRVLKQMEVPEAVIGRSWRPLVFNGSGRVDKRAYTFCVLDQLRRGLRRHDIYVPGSRRWADPRAQLLSGAAWDSARSHASRALNLSEDGAVQVASLARQLDAAYRRTVGNLTSNAAVTIEQVGEESIVSLSPLEKQEDPASLAELRATVAASLPQVDLPDLLLEVAAWTGFAREFTHVSEAQSRAVDIDVSICAVLLAEACNIGLEPLAQTDVPALAPDRLAWVAQNYVRAETIARANARLVDFHASLPLVQAWGGGEVASADGLRFTVPVRTVHAGYNSRYFGNERGVTFYNYVSDQFSGFHALVIPGTLRDSLFILDGLLEQQTSLKPTEIMSDTAGYSDVVFGLFHLLGYQFSPRLADVSGARFWRIDARADYGPLQGIARQRVNTELIKTHWDDLLRVAASLKQGVVSASDLVRALQARPRPATLGRAIGEVGRVAKTLYLLSYIDNEAYRRRILVQLNRGESRHALARAVFYGRRGALYQRYREGQEDQLGALGLVVNMIVLWNTRYMARALEHRGAGVRPQDVERLSPVLHEHINFLGRYRFDLAEDVARGALRPLTRPGQRR